MALASLDVHLLYCGVEKVRLGLGVAVTVLGLPCQSITWSNLVRDSALVEGGSQLFLNFISFIGE